MGNSIIMTGGAGGIDPDECTAGRPQVLSGYTAGVHGEDDPAPGTMPERDAWSSTVGMNESVTIPDGHHSGSGKVNGPAVTQRGAWNSRIDINGRTTIPEGYHNGQGYVDQAIATQGGQTINPSASQQTVSTSGKYMTGNIIINAINLPSASDLREGVNWYGRVGTLKDYSYLATNHVPFDGASFSGVMVKGAEKCNWYNNSIMRGAAEITSLGIRLPYSRVSGYYNKFCPKESINFTPFSSVKITTRYTGTMSGKGHCTVCLYDANTSRSDILRSGSDDTLKYMTIDMPNVNTDYIGYLDVSGITGEAFLTIHFTNSADREYPDYFIRKIEI